MEDVLPVVEEEVSKWWDLDPPANLLLLGPVGLGKTHCAMAVAERWHAAGRSVAVRPMVELLDALRPGGRDGEWSEVVSADLLVLDDVGMEKASDWTDERVYAVVNRRWLDARPIVATSNLRPSALRKALGERTYSRLAGSGTVVIVMSGRDRRANP